MLWRLHGTCALPPVPLSQAMQSLFERLQKQVDWFYRPTMRWQWKDVPKVLSAPTLNRKYRKLASSEIPVTELLFGDDLKAACANIDSTSKLGLSALQSPRGRKFFPQPQRQNFPPKNWEWRRGGRNQSWSGPSWRGRGQSQPRGRGFRYQGKQSFRNTPAKKTD